MATQTGSYDFKAAKAAHDEAAKTASNYITEITSDGIMVHAEGEGPDDTQTPTGWHISDVLELIKSGITVFKVDADGVVVGKTEESHIELTSSGIDMLGLYGRIVSSYAEIAPAVARFGREGGIHTKAGESGFEVAYGQEKWIEVTGNPTLIDPLMARDYYKEDLYCHTLDYDIFDGSATPLTIYFDNDTGKELSEAVAEDETLDGNVIWAPQPGHVCVKVPIGDPLPELWVQSDGMYPGRWMRVQDAVKTGSTRNMWAYENIGVEIDGIGHGLYPPDEEWEGATPHLLFMVNRSDAGDATVTRFAYQGTDATRCVIASASALGSPRMNVTVPLKQNNIPVSLEGHTHSASDITSGTLPESRGGTGTSSLLGGVKDAIYNIALEDNDDYGAVWVDEDLDDVTAGAPLPVKYGGTGASTAEDARTNLGVAAASHNHDTAYVNVGGDTMTGDLILQSGEFITVDKIISRSRGISYIAGAAGNAALYAPKNSGAVWYPAVCLRTSGEGSWQIGNYNNEYLEFVYATKANIDAQNNQTTKVQLPNKAGTICLVDHTHDASDIASGTLDAARIPALAASKITSGTFAAARIPTLAQTKVEPIYYQARGSGDLALTANTMAQVALTTTGALHDGTGLSIASGGIKIANAGRYRISASAYIICSGANYQNRQVFVRRGANSAAWSSATEVMSATDHFWNAASGAVNISPFILQCAANDIIHLVVRTQNGAGTVDRDNAATYLLVERLS